LGQVTLHCAYQESSAVLSEVARFRAPVGTADAGAYELRDEVFDEVDPFFYHYTCNRREDVERILLARLRCTTGIAEPVLVPKLFGISGGPFVTLQAGWESAALMQVLFLTCW
jgi:E3 ubiquitin-protein ligase UBR1